MSEPQGDAPPPKKGKKRLILIVAGALVVLGGGGGGAWYFLAPKPDAAASQADARAKKSRHFSTLEPFTVNLADPGGDRFVQASVVLEMADGAAANKVTANIPAIRNAVLLLLSTKSSQSLLTVEGKTELAAEIAMAAGQQLGWTPANAGRTVKTASAQPVAGKPEATGAQAAKPAGNESPNPVEGVHFVQFIIQ